jgi:hypothetical protein
MVSRCYDRERGDKEVWGYELVQRLNWLALCRLERNKRRHMEGTAYYKNDNSVKRESRLLNWKDSER